MTNARTWLAVCVACAALAACGGDGHGNGGGAANGGGDGGPAGIGTADSGDVPASALASMDAFVAFVRQLATTETGEPLTLPDTAAPTSETEEAAA